MPSSSFSLTRIMNVVAGGTAALALAGTVLWYFARLDARIVTLETRVAAESSTDDTSDTAVSCRELAAQAAAAYRNGDGSAVAVPLERLMDRLGCERAP